MYREHDSEACPDRRRPGSDPAGGDCEGIVFDVKRYAVHDGPGIRTTVFLKGCPLRCLWCHNPESWRAEAEPSLRVSRCRGCGRCVERCHQGAITCTDGVAVTDPARCVVCGQCLDACAASAREIIGRTVRVSQLLAEIERDELFFDESGGGVTFSGGEPLMQADFVAALAAGCAERHIHTALDTTCHAPWETLRRMIRSVDLFLCDLKHMDSAAHERLTGVPNGLILENIGRLVAEGKTVFLRVPVIPGLNDGDENFRAIGEFAAHLAGIDRVDLLPYNEAMQAKAARLAHDYALWQAKTPARERMEQIARRLEGFGLRVKIDG